MTKALLGESLAAEFGLLSYMKSSLYVCCIVNKQLQMGATFGMVLFLRWPFLCSYMTLFTARRISPLSSLRIGHLQSLTGKLVTSKSHC